MKKLRVGTVAIAYNEERFIKPHLQHIPDWVEEKLVLVSTHPWQGEPEEKDATADVARDCGATVIEYHWESEHDQRNTAQDYFHDFDWIIVLDPDEFLDNAEWESLHSFIRIKNKARPSHSHEAYITSEQTTYWKSGYKIDPPEDYKQIILVRPSVRFFDKRCVNVPYAIAPVNLHHFSWARTDKECLSKITHYAHAHELNKDWYQNVWLADKRENVHPLTPDSLKKVVPTELPPELERLDLWP